MWAGIVSRIRSANRLKRFTKLRKGLIITAAGLAALGMTLTSVAQTGHANPSQLQHLDSQEKQVVLKVEDQAVQNPAKFQEKKDSYKKISSAAIRISQFVTMANNALLIGSPSFDEAERLLLRAHNEFKLIQERLLGEDIFVSSTLVINLMQDLDCSTDRMVGFDWDDTVKRVQDNIQNGRFDESYRDVERFKQRVVRLQDLVNKDAHFHNANKLEREIMVGERDYKYSHELSILSSTAEKSHDLGQLNSVVKTVTKELNIIRKDKSVLRDLGEDPNPIIEQMNEIRGVALAKKAEVLIVRAETHQSINDLFLAKMDATQAVKYGNTDAVEILEHVQQAIASFKGTKTVPRHILL